jgi:hypothetical protein
MAAAFSKGSVYLLENVREHSAMFWVSLVCGVCLYMFLSIYIHICIYVNVHICIYVNVHICVYLCGSVREHSAMFWVSLVCGVCLYMFLSIYIYVLYICIYFTLCIYANVHTCVYMCIFIGKCSRL